MKRVCNKAHENTNSLTKTLLKDFSREKDSEGRNYVSQFRLMYRSIRNKCKEHGAVGSSSCPRVTIWPLRVSRHMKGGETGVMNSVYLHDKN